METKLRNLRNRLLVIGLDGATYDLLLPWVEEGYLPNLRNLLTRGISGTLRTTYPPLTGPAWSSFMTGRSPGCHGILEFFHRTDEAYIQVLNNRTDIRGHSLWGLLGDAGLKVGVVGFPLTYPPEAVHGFLITGLLTPPGRKDFTYPRAILKELEDKFGEYRLRHDEKYRPQDPYPFIYEQFEILEHNTQVAHYLLTTKDWDVFLFHILGTDRIQHELWHTLDPKHPNHDPSENARLGNIVRKYFSKVDETIGRLLSVLDENTSIMIMSDHGFGPVYKFININTWLLKEKLLVLKKDVPSQVRYFLLKRGFNYRTLGKLILRLGIGRFAKGMGRGNRETWQRKLFLSLKDVDWSKSKVYSMGNFGQLFVNLSGREPEGIVSPGREYEELLGDLEKRLLALSDPETGKPVIERIMRNDEVYQGPFRDQAPDLMFLTRNMEYKAMGLSDFSSDQVLEPVYGTTGHHRMDGILICCGEEVFKQATNIHGANIHDLAPTILHLMGVDVPMDMDGQILVNLFTEDFRHSHPISYREDTRGDFDTTRRDWTEKEEAELSALLRSLGYVN